MKYKTDKYKICSCGRVLKHDNRTSISFHRNKGHKVPMKKYTIKEINETVRKMKDE